MMLGKRSSGRPASAGHSMRRTTSMTEFAPPDVLANVAEEEEEEDEDEDEDEELQLMPVQAEAVEAAEESYGWAVGGAAAAGMRADWLASYRARAAPALRRNSADFSAAEMSAAFLRACGLCNRRLGPGRDTFMYRGDTAFCSLECRQQHITIEEWKKKCTALATTSATDEVAPASAGPDKSAAGGTLAAA